MAQTFEQQINTGLFLPESIVFDVNRLHEVDVNSDEFKDLLVILYQNINSVMIALNKKDTGYHLTQEFVTGSLYFNPSSTDPLLLRPVFRKTIDMGALTAGANTIAHGLMIGTTWKFVHIYGAANDSGGSNYYPLPFASAAGSTNIELRVDSTNVIVTNNSGLTFDSCTVDLEYVKF